MRCTIVFGTKDNIFLDCAGLKGLNNTDPDTNNLGPFLFFLFPKYICDNFDVQIFGCI